VSGSEEASRAKVTLWLLFACFLLLMKLRHTISLVSSERDEGSKVWQPFFYGKVWQLWQKCREGGGSVFSEVLRRRGNIAAVSSRPLVAEAGEPHRAAVGLVVPVAAPPAGALAPAALPRVPSLGRVSKKIGWPRRGT